jgi:hypothetical protein
MTEKKDRTGLVAGVAKWAKGRQPAPEPVQAPEKPKPEIKSLTVWLHPSVIRQFKIISAEYGKTQVELMNDMMNWCFREHGKPEIAEKPEGKE